MNTFRIILTTGGTGGHIFPALAVAEQIQRLNPQAEILFVGSQYGPESKLAQEAGLQFIGLPVRGVLGRGFRALSALAAMARAICSARGIIARFCPDVVAGFGSYASMPAMAAARLAGIPIAVHEQNAVSGLSNRLMGRMASRIFLSLPDHLHSFDEKRCIFTGNPVRSAIASLFNVRPKHRDDPRPHLLVMGGSQGAKAINSAILASLPRFSEIFIRHQTGAADYERVKAGYEAHGINNDQADVLPFISDVAAAYADADIVLCRAGATTVAELALAGKPSVLIPFPYATHDHQTGNARAMENAGAAVLIAEKELPERDLTGEVLELLHDPQRLEAMGRAARKCAKPNAAHDVACGLFKLKAERNDAK